MSDNQTLHAQVASWPLCKAKYVTVPSGETSQQRNKYPLCSAVVWVGRGSTQACFTAGSALWTASLKTWSHHDRSFWIWLCRRSLNEWLHFIPIHLTPQVLQSAVLCRSKLKFPSLELCPDILTCRIYPLEQGLTLLLSWPTLLLNTHLRPGLAAPPLALPNKAQPLGMKPSIFWLLP